AKGCIFAYLRNTMDTRLDTSHKVILGKILVFLLLDKQPPVISVLSNAESISPFSRAATTSETRELKMASVQFSGFTLFITEY
ncbi:MAG: hypothetical protein OES29_02955, partial [Desulfuromonadales bacterium]|nr:hypothetical protein [Desulfuromonadales bacterium]